MHRVVPLFSVVLHGMVLNPLNAELNPICYLLALLGVHHFLHISRIRVNWAQVKVPFIISISEFEMRDRSHYTCRLLIVPKPRN